MSTHNWRSVLKLLLSNTPSYLCSVLCKEGIVIGDVIVSVCLSVCLSVCVSAGQKLTDLM